MKQNLTKKDNKLYNNVVDLNKDFLRKRKPMPSRFCAYSDGNIPHAGHYQLHNVRHPEQYKVYQKDIHDIYYVIFDDKFSSLVKPRKKIFKPLNKAINCTSKSNTLDMSKYGISNFTTEVA